MGTRGAFGWVHNGVEKFTYNHWDSYPDGLGVDVLTWLRGADLVALPALVDALEPVPDTEPTEEDFVKYAKYHDLQVSTGTDWYSLLRHTQGAPGLILESGRYTEDNSFPLDSLFCEWVYLVDLDAGVFEVYEGFRKTPPTDGRWAGRAEAQPSASGGSYYPVQRIAFWKLTELPTDDEFLAATQGEAED